MAVRTGDAAPEFDLEVAHDERVRLSELRDRANVLLVFHPFAFTPVCEDEARDLQENLQSFRDAGTEIVFVSCDPSAARQAWKAELGAEYTFASDFWPTAPPRRPTASSTSRTARHTEGRSSSTAAERSSGRS